MLQEIKKATTIKANDNVLILTENYNALDKYLNKDELKYVKQAKEELTHINKYTHRVIVFNFDSKQLKYGVSLWEYYRRSGAKALNLLNSEKINQITIVDEVNDAEKTLAFAEGMALMNYQFLKYKTEPKANKLSKITIKSKATKASIDELNNLIKATYYTRDLVNEPVCTLNAVQLSKEIKRLGKEAGFKVEVFNKTKIEALKMGGLLAVNKGSIDPPTFTIMEWKPANPKNKKPIVLVGKGVVYDTGGLSLKPTPNSMDLMKSDMGGAAAVTGVMFAVAKNKLPFHVIALVPATDNRPGGNAYAPGDVITMHNKKTVEVLNTDAEGRMILADALSYAQKYNPELVVDAATLTGAAARAIGKYAAIAMGKTVEDKINKLKEIGEKIGERIVQFPFWDDYNEQMESTVADIKNIGGAEGGAITAGKFLENFTNYPYIHVDIAGPAFMTSNYNYWPVGGTGFGVRLFYQFIKNYNG